MAFKAELDFGGKKYNLINFSYKLFQEIDSLGQPSSCVRGGRVKCTIESSGETSFFESMADSFKTDNGSIRILKRNSDGTLKEVKFTEGYVVQYKENFDATGQSALTETFTISAKELTCGSGDHKNEWVI